MYPVPAIADQGNPACLLPFRGVLFGNQPASAPLPTPVGVVGAVFDLTGDRGEVSLFVAGAVQLGDGDATVVIPSSTPKIQVAFGSKSKRRTLGYPMPPFPAARVLAGLRWGKTPRKRFSHFVLIRFPSSSTTGSLVVIADLRETK